MSHYRSYDHGIRNAIAETGNPDLFPALDIPRTTAESWIRKGVREVVTSPDLERDNDELIRDYQLMKARVDKQQAAEKLTTTVFHIFGFRLQYKRLPTADSKLLIIDAIQNAARHLTLGTCLSIIGLSKSRFSAWKRRLRECGLTDRKPCPKLISWALTASEVSKIKHLVTSKEFAHFSISGLIHYARRKGIVFAGEGTWYKTVKEFNLRRPFGKVHPSPPQTGIRANRPNQIWHIDVTKIKLSTGKKMYLQAVVDNFSRFVLAWKVSDSISGINTRDLLRTALSLTTQERNREGPVLISDGGPENKNLLVSELVNSSPIEMLVALVDIHFSNSLIERFFYRLKKQYLCYKHIPSENVLIKHAAFFIGEHNHTMPMEILEGATPWEMWTGNWNEREVSAISDAAARAREDRVKYHRGLNCHLCSA